MMSRSEILENLNTVWDSLIELGQRLTPEQWATPALCPGWTVTSVYVHLTAVEEAMVGWFPAAADSPPPFEEIVARHRELSDLDAATVLARFIAATNRRRAELAKITETEWESPCLTPIGPGTYGSFIDIRVFDCWVHERDVRVPLGIAGDDGGAPANLALNTVERSLGYIVGKRAGFSEGQSAVFDVTGPVTRRMCVEVAGRAQLVDEIAEPSVTVNTDSLTLMLLACGRIDPEEPIADGRISWIGDDELGGRLARNMGFTI